MFCVLENVFQYLCGKLKITISYFYIINKKWFLCMFWYLLGKNWKQNFFVYWTKLQIEHICVVKKKFLVSVGGTNKWKYLFRADWKKYCGFQQNKKYFEKWIHFEYFVMVSFSICAWIFKWFIKFICQTTFKIFFASRKTLQ